jgi:predicted Zn-dependent peptidase
MVEVTELGSGLRVVTEAVDAFSSASLGVWVGVGSRDEAPSQAGVSHFLEHLLFKGTDELTARDVARILDRIGGESNAFTTREATAYWVRCLADDLREGLGILLDITTRPALRPEDVETERGVMLEEMYQHLDEPSDVAWEKFMETAFPNSPLGRDVQGTPETVGALSRDEIASFFEERYRSASVVFAAAGKVSHESLVEAVEKAFAKRQGSPGLARETPPPSGPGVVLTAKDTEQVHLVYGFRSISTRDERRYAMGVYNQILGGSMSSRLFQEVREKRGLVYHIHSEWVGFTDAGVELVAASSSPGNAAEVVSLVREQIELLASEGFSEDEFALAKSHLAADTVLSSEDSLHRMNRLGASLTLRGEVKELEEMLAAIRAVTPEEVLAMARQVASSPPVLSAVGRAEALKPLEGVALEAALR